MDHELTIKYIQALGFPICSAVALAWALWKIGGQLLKKFFEHVDSIGPKLDKLIDTNVEIRDQVSKWPSDLVAKVTDSVMERFKRDMEKAMGGCHLSDRDIAILFEHHMQKKPT